MSLSLAPIAKALRLSLGIRTSENDVACLAYGLVNPVTGALTASGRQTPIAADGPVSIAGGGGDYIITKPSAAALTLPAPTAAQNGATLVIVGNSGFAHQLTATNLFFDGTSAVGKTIAAWPGGFIGASLTLKAYAGRWMVITKNGVTIS